MKIAFNNVWAEVNAATPEEMAWLRDYLGCEDVNYRPGMWGKKGGKEEHHFSVLSEVTNRFPAGLLLQTRHAARRDGVALECEDFRQRPCQPDYGADLSWLRDYQREAVLKACKAVRGLIKAPTGSGKTEIAVGLTYAIPCEWLFLVHRTDLVSNAAERYRRRTGETAGTFSSKGWVKGSGNFTVSTFQTIHRALKTQAFKELQAGITGLMVDEVHAQPAATFYRTSMMMKHAFYRIGLSGTPLDRTDKSTLMTIGVVGPLIYEIATDFLIGEGVLAKPTIRMIPCRQVIPKVFDAELQDYREPQKPWSEVYQELVVRSEARNAVLTDIVAAAAKPCLVFVDEKLHGDRLLKLFRAEGLAAEFVYGTHGLPKRQAMVKHLVDDRCEVLICTVIFQEGIDIPELASVVIAAGKSSAIAAKQRMGRGMRTASGKTTFEVWDIKDQGQHWLSNHAQDRWNAYAADGHEVTTDWPDPFTPGTP